MAANRIVHKYKNWVIEDGEAIMETPLGKVLLVAPQFSGDELPTLWIERFFGINGLPNDADKQTFVMHGTGHPAIWPREEHVGSCVVQSGLLVWHVYRRP